MTTKTLRNIAIALFVIIASASMTACGNGNRDYSLTSPDQGNVTTVYHTLQCMANACNH